MTMILIMILMAIVIFTAILWFTEHYEAAGAIIMIVGTIVIIYGVMVWWPSFQCKQKVAPSGNECSWDIFAGCQVKINGQWIPYEKWRVFE